jgi:hypothetical protein
MWRTISARPYRQQRAVGAVRERANRERESHDVGFELAIGALEVEKLDTVVIGPSGELRAVGRYS